MLIMAHAPLRHLVIYGNTVWCQVTLASKEIRAATAAKDAKDWSLPSFGSHLNPISTRGGQIMPTLYWGPWLARIRRGGHLIH